MTRSAGSSGRPGAEYLVVKNRLVVRVLEELELDHDELTEQLRAPPGSSWWTRSRWLRPRPSPDFAKAHGDRPVFKVGLLDEKVVEASQFDRLAKLPPKEQLLAELAGALEAPMAMLAAALEAKLQETSGLLDALREKKAAE
jgi:large subunit ribosomal protein L10